MPALDPPLRHGHTGELHAYVVEKQEKAAPQGGVMGVSLHEALADVNTVWRRGIRQNKTQPINVGECTAKSPLRGYSARVSVLLLVTG